jgi:predicted O-methyltransferase YrrM
MADQALAQAGALKQLARQEPGRRFTLCYKLAWRWKAIQCWARYALAGRRRGVPGLVDFVLGNYYFRAMQVPSEIAAFGEILAERRPERALEIGTAQGGTLFLLTRLASPQATIVSVDLPGGMFGGGYSARRKWFYQRFARRNQRLHLLQGDSHSAEMLEQVNAALAGQPLDYLFIDGDHRYDGVKRDFEMYGPLVRKGGLIAFHDIVEGPSEAVGGVPQLWREIKYRYRHVEFIKDPQQGGLGLGVLFIPD